MPIVSLMAFLIGVVLAFQGADQLRQFGAEIFVVDLIGISILRELGILLTAIIVAGRSASAFTAAIGSMKMREEIDAMRTLGLDPVEVLVVPRVLALMLTLPLLGFFADMMGLVGGAHDGLDRARHLARRCSRRGWSSRPTLALRGRHHQGAVLRGDHRAGRLLRGPEGRGQRRVVGRNTSTSVVLAIFLVIVADAVFSIFFAVVGV